MINRAVLVGRLTKDPELRYTNSNVGVVTFTLAVNRNFVGKDNVKADFIPCVAWNRGKYMQADNCAKYLNKGSLAAIDGYIQTRNYEASDGTKRYITEIICDSVKFLDTKPKDEQAQYQKQEVSSELKVERDKTDPFFASSNIEVEEDDLPF
jgi:single-strand DNA-binding protein